MPEVPATTIPAASDSRFASRLALLRVTVSTVSIPTSKFAEVIGESDVLDLGSFVSESLNVLADSS